MIEDLAEAAHNAWMAEKKVRGVVSWPNERGIEQMVPYSELDDDIREFDRIVVQAMLTVLEGNEKMTNDEIWRKWVADHTAQVNERIWRIWNGQARD